MNTASTQNTGLTARKVTNASLFRARNHFRASPVAPLSLKDKLVVVNAFLRQNTKATVILLPPAQVVLTPAQPIQGQSSIAVYGLWDPWSGTVAVSSQFTWGESCINLVFSGLASGSYLLDISVSCGSGDAWGAGAFTLVSVNYMTLVSQSGHLLYPFTGSEVIQVTITPPSTGAVYNWTKAELTKVA